jgi:hypothetical protein
MPMTPAERRRRVKIAAARRELEKAIHAARRFRELFRSVGTIAKVDPGFPPPIHPCGGRLRTSQTVTKKQLDQGMAKIGVALIKTRRVCDKMLRPTGARR